MCVNFLILETASVLFTILHSRNVSFPFHNLLPMICTGIVGIHSEIILPFGKYLNLYVVKKWLRSKAITSLFLQ